MPVCSDCGRARPSPSVDGEREPCPDCGGTALTFQKTIGASVTFSTSMTASMEPGDQERDSDQRWRVLQERWARLELPRTDPMSSASIASAERDLLSFSVDLYHLKDYLKLDGYTDVEAIVSNTPALARLADLANLDKHADLNRPPRSGHVPVIETRRGTTSQGGWRLELDIRYGADVVDGFEIIATAMEAWGVVISAN